MMKVKVCVNIPVTQKIKKKKNCWELQLAWQVLKSNMVSSLLSLLFLLLHFLYPLLLLSENVEYSVKIFGMGFPWRLDKITKQCGNVHCEYLPINSTEQLRTEFNSTCSHSYGRPLITVSKYDVFLGWDLPLTCDAPTHLEMYETGESLYRLNDMFEKANKVFKYNSSTYITSAIRLYYYPGALIDPKPLRLFPTMIKGAAFIQSHCDSGTGSRQYKVPSNREAYVLKMRELGFRVDGLAKCLHTPNITEGIVLEKGDGRGLSKLDALNHYLFSIAFENFIEPGYVTEKPTDPLGAGSVPIYLGDEVLLKELSPHPKAVIYVADFNYNIEKLVEYLKYLSNNETAYEEHRVWRKSFKFWEYIKAHPQFSDHDCKVCKWAVNEITVLAGPHNPSSNIHNNSSSPMQHSLFQSHRWKKFKKQHEQRVHDYCKNDTNKLLFGESFHNKLASCNHPHSDQTQ